MSGNRRKAFLVTAALMGAGMLMTACQDTSAAPGAGAAQGSSPAGSASGPAAGSATPSGSPKPTAKASGGTDKGTKDGTGAGDGKPVGQVCGANDIAWSTRSESQAGGYILVIAKAKPGITCVLPAALPTVAFGSDGTQAGPAEQAVGKQITLTGNTTAYAGVNPKSTKANGGKELESIIVAVGDNDPNPVSLPVPAITVDKPVVTNWHTAPKDAVPFK
ncbi:DUF4232 domain-containing protein [Streptomyces sp. NBC_00536]|uniref:DUF4232 domain-containing protein n=1 Tax=Streptomyces sp. NBC_00536 TaxID=2975769 RepID=UPI002E80328B|nr:DUF4232 domain-containing protein [Streptomyces sp. NBC_00536]WUC77010.1 DUF4232 domain-containing protein [Streptomyces sp. NBC_00536]